MVLVDSIIMLDKSITWKGYFMYSVSCIVPVYNLENRVKKCVESLLLQTLKDIEIILVNDCSTDNSLAVLKKYADENYNVKVLNLPNNLRQGGARNRGLEIASGEYVVFIDGDDWIERDMLEQLYDYAKENDCDIVDSDYYQENGKGESSIKQSIKEELFPINSSKVLICNAGRIVTKIFRREFLIENNIKFIEKKKFEDNPYLPIVFAYTIKVGKVNKPFYHYIYNQNSTSRRKNDITVFDRLDTSKFLLEEAKRRCIYNKFKEEYDYVFIQLFFINTLVTCITKFDILPIKHISKIYKELNILLPEYKKNSYLVAAPRYIRLFVRLNKIGVITSCILLSIADHIGLHRYLVRKGKS